AAGLPGDAGFRAVGICATSFATIDAAIGVTEQHLTLVVDGCVREVEQVAARIVSAAIPNARLALHWPVRRCVHRRPRLAAVVCMRDKAVPRSLKGRGLVIAACGCAYEANRGAIRITSDCGSKHGILDANARANIDRRAPRQP